MFAAAIPWKLIGIGIAVLAVIAVIYFGFQHYKDLLEDNKQLELNNQSLTQANTGLTNQIVQLKEVQKDIQNEMSAARNSTEKAEQSIKDLRDQISDKERQSRVAAIEESRKASLYLKFVQNYEECLANHYTDFDGTCNFRGNFKKDEKPTTE